MARRRSRATRRAARWAVLAVLVAVLVFGAVIVLSRQEGVDIRLGDDEFSLRTGSVAAAIARDGPVLYPDASPNRSRDIFVQHLSTNQDEGWLAFAAQAPGAPRECQLQWEAASATFLDPCSGRRYPADGEGLTRYAVRLDGDRLYVNLNDSRTPETAP
jgi:hypothetical protein